MDNNYFTEKIAPKNKTAQENTQPKQTQPVNIPDDLTEHRANHDGKSTAQPAKPAPVKQTQPAQPVNIPDDLTEHRANHPDDKREEKRPERRENSPKNDGNRAPRQERRDVPRREKKPAEPGALTEIIGVRFKDVGKVYYFAPGGVQFEQGDQAIVETARGVECG